MRIIKFNFKTINIFHDNQWKYCQNTIISKKLWINCIFLKLNDKIICISLSLMNLNIFVNQINLDRYIFLSKKITNIEKYQDLKKYVLILSSLFTQKYKYYRNTPNTDSFKDIKILLLQALEDRAKNFFGNKSIIYMSKISNPEKIGFLKTVNIIYSHQNIRIWHDFS